MATDSGPVSVDPVKREEGEGSAARTTAILLRLEKEARAAPTRQALGFTAVNRSRTLVAYDQAAMITFEGRRARVRAVSNVAVLDRNAPFVRWLQATMRRVGRDSALLAEAGTIAVEDLDARDREGAAEFWARHVLWVPWTHDGGSPSGGILFSRANSIWRDPEKLLLDSLCDCYGHAWRALGRGRDDRGRWRMARRAFGWLMVATVLAAMAIPVPQSIVAPARVVPLKPLIVAAPMEGVVRDITVFPNERVSIGQPLFRYVAAELEANLAVAERAVAAAEADLRRATQQAFGDPVSKADVALKQAALELKLVELNYGRYLASQIVVTAEQEGVAIFTDPAEWRGRPVQTGVRVMEIADPDRVRLDIDIPVGDAVTLRHGAEVALFLDTDPLNPVSATLDRVSYGAEPTLDNTLAYRASADLIDGTSPPRIGLHGTVRIFGDPVPLGLFLFRKPLSALRGFLGF